MQVAARRLSLDAAFLAELTPTEQRYGVATAAAGTFTIEPGASLPRSEGFCHHVLERGAPWVVPDTTADPVAAAVPVRAVGGFGAYVGVPVRHPDGRDYGTLCCVSHDPQPALGERDAAVLTALADVLGYHLAQLQTAAEQRRTLEDDAAELGARLRSNELELGLLSELVQAARTPALVLDPTTLTIQYANHAAAQLLGTTAGELLDTEPWDHAPSWREEVVRGRLESVLSGAVPVVRFEIDDVTEEPRVLDVVAQRVVAGERPAVLVTGHDVTVHRHAEQRLAAALEREQEAGRQLRRLDELRTAFLTAVSHELRTPLTTVRLVAETLQDRRSDPELSPLLLRRLLANAERLDRLLSDLLDLHQFTHGRPRLAAAPARLDDLVRTAVAELEPTEHELVLDLAPVTATVAPVKFERIVANLVRNAVVHTSGGVITVRLTEHGGEALLTVTDEGAGVAVEDRERLFRPFEQGATVPDHQPGTGIGLSLVRTFTELHGGRAWVDAAPGGGAEFCVALPLEPSTHPDVPDDPDTQRGSP